MTIDAILKFIMLEGQKVRAHIELPRHVDLDELLERNLLLSWEGRIAREHVPHVELETFTCQNGEPGAVVIFHLKDWPEMKREHFRLRKEPVRLHLEPMQPALFGHEDEGIGMFINQRMRRDVHGIRKGML